MQAMCSLYYKKFTVERTQYKYANRNEVENSDIEAIEMKILSHLK